jgi:glyoxylase-like metal-dependent hydrolase (beta-lactamase superfamily II)
MDVLLVRAANPSPFTLDGTNTWIVGHDPAWIVDPGPALPEHLDAIVAAVEARGGPGGIALTHDHPDHAEGLPALRARLGDPPVGRMPPLRDGDAFGPFIALHVPGHAADHLVFVAGRAAFTGDAVLGAGSVFIAPGQGGLAAYLDGLRRLRALDLEAIYPGHGDPVTDPAAKLDAYLAHRAERERKLLAALEAGARTEDELLDAAWDDAPASVRQFAALSLRAHMEKLQEEGHPC